MSKNQTTAVNRVRLAVHTLEARDVPSNTLISNTTAYPHSTTVKISATWDVNRNGRADNGESFVGTGTMISRFQVLTAGHVIYDNNPLTRASGYASWVTVTPGLNGTAKPFGTASGTYAYVPTAYQRGDHKADLGVIALNRAVGFQTGTMGFASYGNNRVYVGATVNVLHYPAAGLSGTRMYQSSGPLRAVGTGSFTYSKNSITTVGGSSGAGVYVKYGTTRMIVGVHSGAINNGREGIATRINSTWFTWISATLRRNSQPSVRHTGPMRPGTMEVAGLAGTGSTTNYESTAVRHEAKVAAPFASVEKKPERIDIDARPRLDDEVDSPFAGIAL